MNREAIQQYCDRAEACPKETLEGCLQALRYIDKAITLLLRDGVREADASRVCALACRFEVLAVARHAARLAKARSTVDAQTNYDVLGLKRDFSRDALKRSYRELTLQLHPDRNSQDALCVEAFKRITGAHHVLTDPTKRRAYDMTLQLLPSSWPQLLLPYKSHTPPEPQPAPKKKCDHCDALCFVALKRCPSCGFEFVKKRSEPAPEDSSLSKSATPRTRQPKKKHRVRPEDDGAAETSYASRADRCYERVRTGSIQLVQILEANASHLQAGALEFLATVKAELAAEAKADLAPMTDDDEPMPTGGPPPESARVTSESAFLRHAAELERRTNALLAIAERMPEGFEYPPGLREALPFLRMHMTRITIERTCGNVEEGPPSSKRPSAKRPPPKKSCTACSAPCAVASKTCSECGVAFEKRPRKSPQRSPPFAVGDRVQVHGEGEAQNGKIGTVVDTKAFSKSGKWKCLVRLYPPVGFSSDGWADEWFQAASLCLAPPEAPKAAPKRKKDDGVDDAAASLQKHAKMVSESGDESVASDKWALCEDIDSEHSSDSDWSPEKTAAEFQCVDNSLSVSEVETLRPGFGPPSVAVRGREVGTAEWVTYQSGATEAGDELDLDSYAITECASGNRKSLHGYEFQFIQPEQRSRRTAAKCAARTARGGTSRGDGRARGATNAEGEQPEVEEVDVLKAVAARQVKAFMRKAAAAKKAAAERAAERSAERAAFMKKAAAEEAEKEKEGEERWVQCERCDKWRRLTSQAEEEEEAEAWVCSLNPDPDFNRCEAPQEFSDEVIDRRLGLGGEEYEEEQERGELVTEVRSPRLRSRPPFRYFRAACVLSQLEGYQLERSENNSSGYANVSKQAGSSRWKAMVSGKYLGTFESPEEAALAVATHRAGLVEGEAEEEEQADGLVKEAEAAVAYARTRAMCEEVARAEGRALAARVVAEKAVEKAAKAEEAAKEAAKAKEAAEEEAAKAAAEKAAKEAEEAAFAQAEGAEEEGEDEEEASMACFRERRSTPKQSSRATASAERPRSEASSSMEVDGAPASPARPKREKRSKPSRYDDIAREAEDAEGRAWRLIIDPKVESALYTNYEGTGYKGVVENGWFGAGYEGKMKTHPYTMREKGNVIRFKTAVEAAVAYARVQAGLPAKLQEDEEQQQEDEEEEDDEEEEVEDEEAEEDGEEEDEEDEQSLTDCKLWEGAAAAGWQLKVHHQNHYTYIAPNDRRFSSKRAAESWSDGDGSEAGEAASGGEESPAPKPRRKRKRPSKAAEPEDPDGEEQVGLPSSETDSEARPISADLERARLAWPISCAHPSLPDLSQARYVDESEEEVEETEEGDEEEQKWPQLEEAYSIDISVLTPAPKTHKDQIDALVDEHLLDLDSRVLWKLARQLPDPAINEEVSCLEQLRAHPALAFTNQTVEAAGEMLKSLVDKARLAVEADDELNRAVILMTR